jgi:hypothetical protein
VKSFLWASVDILSVILYPKQTGGMKMILPHLWLSQVPVLSFSSFDTEEDYDFVYVHDGEDDATTQLHSSSGTDLPDDVTATDANLYVKLTSDSGVEGAGFTASFECQGGGDGGGAAGGRRRLLSPPRHSAAFSQHSVHSMDEQVRDKHRKLLERRKAPAHAEASTTRRQTQTRQTTATPLTLVNELSDLVGQPRKSGLQTRLSSGKIPRANANIDPDGNAKPPVPPKLEPPPPPPPPTAATVMASLQDAGFKFNPQIEGYVFFVPAEFGIEASAGDVQNLAQYRWLDSRTRKLTIRLALYNGNYALFNIVELNMEFDLGGQLKKTVQSNTIDLELFNAKTFNDWLRGFLEIVVIIILISNIIGEGGDVADKGSVMPGGCCAKFTYGLKEYMKSYYSFLDMLNIVFLTAAIITWLMIMLRSQNIEVPEKFDFSSEESSAIDRQRVFNLITDLQVASNYYSFYKAVNIANVFTNLGRVFKFFAAQPKLAVINRTFSCVAPARSLSAAASLRALPIPPWLSIIRGTGMPRWTSPTSPSRCRWCSLGSPSPAGSRLARPTQSSRALAMRFSRCTRWRTASSTCARWRTRAGTWACSTTSCSRCSSSSSWSTSSWPSCLTGLVLYQCV